MQTPSHPHRIIRQAGRRTHTENKTAFFPSQENYFPDTVTRQAKPSRSLICFQVHPTLPIVCSYFASQKTNAASRSFSAGWLMAKGTNPYSGKGWQNFLIRTHAILISFGRFDKILKVSWMDRGSILFDKGRWLYQIQCSCLKAQFEKKGDKLWSQATSCFPQKK